MCLTWMNGVVPALTVIWLGLMLGRGVEFGRGPFCWNHLFQDKVRRDIFPPSKGINNVIGTCGIPWVLFIIIK